MKLTPLFNLHINIGVPVSAGKGPNGRRVFYPLLDGTFEGSGRGGTCGGKALRGTVVPGGGDWILVDDETKTSRLDIRLTLKTDDGWAIYLQAFGIIKVNAAVERRLQDPNLITDFGETYFMTQPRFETGDDLDPATMQPLENPYKWMNDVVAVGQGKLGPSFPGFMAAQWLETRSFIVEN
ncbi:MAG: DUF3237 domain-containing protein [bacterium]